MNYFECQGKEKLIIGHAGKSHPEAVTVDIEPQHRPDVVHDINRAPWPFRDNQFKKIICHHVIEHLNDLHPAIDELHRVCHPQGEIYIEVPHHSAWLAKSPYHKLYFGYFSFDELLASNSGSWQMGKKFELISRE